VTWAGERRDAATLAGAFDAAVVCSHWEGLPLAALEAMSAGVPLVATRVGGLPTLLEGDAGVLVPPADAASLATALDQLMEDTDHAARIGAAGRARIVERYSFEVMQRRVEGIYTDVLEEGARPALRRRQRARGDRPATFDTRREAA
jgi:glycosyltransferase involved in cell wall biosynthesis